MSGRNENLDENMTKCLKKIVFLSENSLIISLAQQKVPHQIIRKVAGVEMSRVTTLLREVKLIKKGTQKP